MEGDKYFLMKPKIETNKRGTTQNWSNADKIDFENVYVASESDTASTITSKINEGLHIVF